MRFFSSEAEAKTEIGNIIRPFFGTAQLTIVDRNAINIGLREVIFAAKVKKDDEKCDLLINAFKDAQVSQSERLEWQGTKMDFMNDTEHEYIMVKAVIENG